MTIRRVNRDTFDVFLSDQYWDGWTRVRMGRNGLYGVAGNRLNKAQMAAIEAEVA